MRPLTHPPLEDITVEGILHALSDPVRATIYADIALAECSQNCSSFSIVNDQEIPKSTLSQHFRILREAGLIHSERKGVEVQNVSRCVEIDKKFQGLIAAIVTAHNTQTKTMRAKARYAAKKQAGRVH